MTISGWYTPQTITQNLNEDDRLIAWKEPLRFPFYTVKPLIHIAGTGGPGPGMTDVRYKTTALKFTNFQIPSETITGIELFFDVDRQGRASDAEVSLVFNDEIISINKTNYDQDEGGHLIHFNNNNYGGDADLWGANITAEMISDASFGVNIRMQSHPFFPHSSTPIIRSVSLRYYSA